MLTHLLTEPDLDALELEMIAKSEESVVWIAALDLVRKYRSESFKRRAKFISPRSRKTLGLRLQR